MNPIKKIIALFLFAIISSSALASLTNPEVGKEYEVLKQTQSTDAVGKKIEVIEFFFYTCPHCNILDPYISEWAKKQGNEVSFKRVPVDFGQGQLPLRRMFYALEAMGKLDELNSRIFKSIHQDRQFIRSDQDVLKFVVKNGVDEKKYLEVSKSFAVETKMLRAQKLQEDYTIDSVPVLFVDGRYKTSPSQVMGVNSGMTEATSAQGVLKVLDALVLKAKKDHEAKK
jgi:thiol:disulfide interchange protein DsbA